MDAKEKRKRVMARSMKLGHCVCDPRKPCPCQLFKDKKVCTCAGERVPREDAREAVRLTQFVRSAGCASKISQKDLHDVLGRLPAVTDPRLVVGMATADDAGVFRLASGLTVVQTVDVFTPVVDDPYLFGRVAACNSLSDVYAMGGRPVTALSIIGFPIYELAHDVMADILRGGMDVLKEAGTVLLGGHSINDEEIKFGFAVTGVIEESAVVTNAGVRPGDVFILTKPLGTGIISLAGQLGKASKPALDAAMASMTSLNRIASEIMVANRASACTDVTGFGFLGHLCRMVVESGVTAEIAFDALPLLPDVMECAAQGMFSGANERNAEYSADRTDFGAGVTEEMKAVLFDPQTSGGLLIAMPESRAAKTVDELHKAGIACAAVVGRVVEKSEGRIRVTPGTATRARKPTRELNAKKEEDTMKKEQNCSRPPQRPDRDLLTPATAGEARTRVSNQNEAVESSECCAHGAVGSDKAMKLFGDFMGAAMQAGAVDAVTKELIAVALGLAVHCVPCSRIHIKKALAMGIGKDELEETAALAVAFAGCRALMLWNELKKELITEKYGA